MPSQLGAVTERVMLGTSILVADNLWRSQLAKRLATIDQLSGGRLIAGFEAPLSVAEIVVARPDRVRRRAASRASRSVTSRTWHIRTSWLSWTSQR